MDKFQISNIEIDDLKEGQYIKPKEFKFTQNGYNKRWEVLDVFDSVAILLYHKVENSFIFVKQFRPAIYLSDEVGLTYELCAGIVDKDKTLMEIAQEEILEEVGYNVPLKHIHKVTSFYNSVGFANGKQTLYYAEVDNSMKLTCGGGVDGEFIEVVNIPLEEINSILYDETVVKTPGLLYGVEWFLREKLDHYK